MPLIDIHCHILPGVDDGARDTVMSLEMLRIAAAQGTTHVILTPHHKPQHRNISAASIVTHARALQTACDEAGIGIKLHTGCELYYYKEAMQLVEEGQIATLAGSKYLLTEFHPSESYAEIRNAAYGLLSLNVVPVIAHIERYAEITAHTDYAYELADLGCRIQVNAATLTGRYGRGLKSFAKRLLKEGLVDFVASDAHNTTERAPLLKDAYRYAAAKAGEAYAQKIFYEHAMQVIRDEAIA